jgi:uncharacterized protein
MKPLGILTLVLVVVGALNWLLVGAAGFDLVAAIFGAGSILSRIVYILVGISGIYQAAMLVGGKSATSMG